MGRPEPERRVGADEAGAWIERTLSGGDTLRTGVVWRLERFQLARRGGL